jgi:hypothetical protein
MNTLKILAAMTIIVGFTLVTGKFSPTAYASQVTGDVNTDGVVNISDLAIMASHWGLSSGATLSMGDLNNDGAVNISDLAVLANHWHDDVADLPSVPSGLSAVTNGTSAVNLSWNADGGGGSITYILYRDGSSVDSTASTSYGDSGLTKATAYTYTVAASNTYGISSQSSGQDAYTQVGKLLGMNAALDNTYNSETTEAGTLQELGVNSERGEIDFNGTTFGDPNGDDTIANWIDQLTTDGIVPLPLMNQYVEISTINTTGFVNATVSWCQAYCAGGTFYTNNTQANPIYAPQMLEILNEPYGDWWGYGTPTTSDIQAYATLLIDLRSALNSAGLTSIGITAGANENSIGTPNWDTDLLNDGGFAAVQGVVVHPYGDLDLSSDTKGTDTDGWGMVYYVHDLLVNAGLTANANIYATEVGWCTDQAAEPDGYTVGADCISPLLAEADKDSNITTVIGQLGSVPWLEGLWYYNLYPYKISTTWNSFGLYQPGTWNGDGLYVSGDPTAAWDAFQSAAQANGF